MTGSDSPPLIIRPCFQQDLESVQLIYATHVLTGTGSFEIEPPSLEVMTERWSGIVGANWPYLVASPLNDLSRVVGFAYAAQYRDRPAYGKTFEGSVYAAPTSLRQGVGSALLNELLGMLYGDGVREVLAFIGDSYNAASIALHNKAGFLHVGTLKNVGEKFGRLLDVVIMQRTLQ
ncbi:MAG: N-acetyltransferase [Proteobacteria bacterium]|nr:N-acetyltransferase [Pseudomonadota bacterium]